MIYSHKHKLIILDTNVIISAHLTKHDDAATRKVYQAATDEFCWLLYSEDILREYIRVLHYPKFQFDKATIRGILDYIVAHGLKLSADPADIKLVDHTDQPFFDLVTTKSAGVPLLITGNLRHYPVCHFVMSPRRFYLRGGVMRAGRP